MTLVSDSFSQDMPAPPASCEPCTPGSSPVPSPAAPPPRLAQLFRRCQGQPHPLQPILQAYRGEQP